MTATYFQNRLPTNATEKTPYEMWNGRKPDLSEIRVFGSKAYFYVPKEKRSKWDNRAEEGIFVGYYENAKGYRILQLATNKIIISRTVNIDEENKSSGIEVQSHVDSNGSEVQSNFTVGSEGMEQSTSNAARADIPTEDSHVWRSSRINKGQPP